MALNADDNNYLFVYLNIDCLLECKLWNRINLYTNCTSSIVVSVDLTGDCGTARRPGRAEGPGPVESLR